MNIDRRLLRWIRVAPISLVITLLAGFFGGLLIILQASQLSRVIAAVHLENRTLLQVMPLLWVLLVTILLRVLIVVLAEQSAGLLAIRVKTVIRELIVKRLLSDRHTGIPGEQTGELSSVLTEGVEMLDAYFSQYLPQLALAVLIPVSILAVVFPMDLISGIVLLLTAPLIPVFMLLIGKTAETMTRRQWKGLGRMSVHFLDMLQGLCTLKELNQHLQQAEKIGEISRRYARSTLNVLRVTFLSSLVLEMVGTLSTAVVAVEIGLRLLSGRMTFEPAFFILIIAPEFYFPLRQLGLRFHAGINGIAAARRIFELLGEGNFHENPASPVLENKQDHLDAGIFDSSKGIRIVFDRVSFSYPSRPDAAVNAISFEMSPGQLVALVGPNGAGKTTISNMLLRFINPMAGGIMVNGQSLADIPLDDWCSLIAWVPQQPALFCGTLADNLCLGKTGASMGEIHQAAKLAAMDEDIAFLPLGYATIIGEQGIRLSTGQAQRLALARAFLKNAPLIVMDEPTAHLDPYLETSLESSVRSLCQNRSVLMIAHRLTTIYQADQILVISGGHIVEQGRHADLLSRKGVYTRMVSAYMGQDFQEDYSL